MRRGIELHEPERNAPCPCGSGKKFKKCCQPSYRQGHSTHARAKYNQGLYEEALVACRIHLCWYVLCHQAHTVPFLKSETKEAFELLAIDIEALAGIVELLHYCYDRVGIVEEFPATLERLKTVVNDPRWLDKIALFNGLWWLINKSNQEQAYKSISAVDIAHCEDPDILMLYLDVTPKSLTIADKVSILDRICARTEQESERLQYTCAKGITYCLICDVKNGCEIIERAIARYQAADSEKKSTYGQHQLAHAYYVLGAFRHDESAINRSIEVLLELIADAKKKAFSKEIISGLSLSLGECYAFLGNQRAAMEHYRASIAIKSRPIATIYLAKAYAVVGLVEKSQLLLDTLEVDTLTKTNHYDYAIALTMIAASKRDQESLERAKAELRKVKSTDPFFIRARDESIIRLLETSPDSDGNTLRKLISRLNRYITLNPNVFGFGLNINRIIEDAEDKYP